MPKRLQRKELRNGFVHYYEYSRVKMNLENKHSTSRWNGKPSNSASEAQVARHVERIVKPVNCYRPRRSTRINNKLRTRLPQNELIWKGGLFAK